MACAFSRRNASPVRITDPVSISSGCRPAAWYASSMILPSARSSIRTSST